ncbi:hypothetical protein BJ964_001093 [Actinoplanes lobatus]|uniref:Uncharacterized protein n=1 Tax=Actinoplanes lobatus TaxID=113568 RepID=A0A7W7HB71_9ACTN|nr:hypothetical protein [Actinoplanes lobatus]
MIDCTEWQPAAAADGLSDEGRESIAKGYSK